MSQKRGATCAATVAGMFFEEWSLNVVSSEACSVQSTSTHMVRVVDANIQHAIAFAKLLVKAHELSSCAHLRLVPLAEPVDLEALRSQDKRPFPQLNAEEV